MSSTERRLVEGNERQGGNGVDTARRYIFMIIIFIIIELVVLYFFIGLTATLWVGGLFLLCSGIFGIHRNLPVTSSLVVSSFYTSIALALGSSIFLFIRFGWIAAVGFVVLCFVVLALLAERSFKYDKRVHLAIKLRVSLQENIALKATGKITQEQLEARFFPLLQRGLFQEVYSLNFVYDHLLSKEGLSDGEYQSYLEMLEQYLSSVDVYPRISNLRAEVRARLGFAPYSSDDFRRDSLRQIAEERKNNIQ